MKHSVTIKGKPIIAIYESFNGSYWYVTEKCFKQDSLIKGKIYQDDQIYFGYVRLASCPECAEWGYISEAELNSMMPLVWKVPQINWSVCPLVEVQPANEQVQNHRAEGGESLQPAGCIFRKLKGGIYENGMETNTLFNRGRA